MSKRGQAMIFVIIAIVIVSVLVVGFAFRDRIFRIDGIDPEFSPLYASFSRCIEEETKVALNILGVQGGVINTGDYMAGSSYSPLSSHLTFMGISIPYWHTVSGNNLVSERVPSRSRMESELSDFIEQRISECELTSFYNDGFYVDFPELDDVKVESRIEDDQVRITVNADIVVSKEDRSSRKTEHEVEVASRIGALHETALDIYEKNVNEGFLEEYAVDVLRLYAPVDGVEIQCTPEVWQTRDVVDELKEGMESNIAAIKFKGNYFDADSAEDQYFVVDLEIPHNVAVNLVHFKDWPSKIEIVGDGVDENLLVAKPIGNQNGLGIMGFCYVPYHFVYDVSIPVLIQLSDNFEIFQFPVAVVIENNLPGEARQGNLLEGEENYDACGFREGFAEVHTFGTNLNAIEADISYRCFDDLCDLGKTQIFGEDSMLEARIPICLNGQLIADAEGYETNEVVFSSNIERSVDMILDRAYEEIVDIEISGRGLSEGESAVVHFENNNGVKTIVLPENNRVVLSEGLYDIRVEVYGNSNVILPPSRKRECFEVIDSGFLGLFGKKDEECIDIEVPGVTIESALIGGGKSNEFILESALQNKKITIAVSELPRPNSIEQLQYNFEIFEGLGVDLRFA